MTEYVGWVPTITGRLSFSRVGDGAGGDACVCNLTQSPHGVLFGIQKRTSRDGPFWPWVTRWMGRFPDTQYLIFLKAGPSLLPYPREDCADASPTEPQTVLRRDERGELAGWIFFINGHEKVWRKEVKEVLDDINREATEALVEGARPIPDAAAVATKFNNAEGMARRLWDDLRAGAAAGHLIPNFGRVAVTLSRTGACRISVEDKDLFTSELIQLAQVADAGEAAWVAADRDLAAERPSVAEQCFFMLRDLAHHHYHHDAEADLLTTTYEWTPATDETWRRETQYGLVRMAIAVRREDSAESYRRSLGIIAYADAFQRHLCGWRIDARSRIQPSDLRFAYDFSALKASIESSLKARELADTSRRTRLIFAFGTIITAISFMLPTIRDANISMPTWSGVTFRKTLELASTHPWEAIIVAAFVGWMVDISALRLAAQPRFLESFAAGSSRLYYGIMADQRRGRRSEIWSRSAALIAIAFFLAISVSLTWLTLGMGMWLLRLVTPD